MMNSIPLRVVINLVALLVLAPAAIYIGRQRYRTGTVRPDSAEFYGLLAYVNIANAIRGRSRVHDLTPDQIRWAGVCYMAIGAMVLVGVVVLLATGHLS